MYEKKQKAGSLALYNGANSLGLYDGSQKMS